MTRFFDPKVQGAFRHMLTAFGPVLASNGWATDAQWQVGVGIVMAIVGFAASWFAPEKTK